MYSQTLSKCKVFNFKVVCCTEKREKVLNELITFEICYLGKILFIYRSRP